MPLTAPTPTWRLDHLFGISRASSAVHTAVVSLTMLVLWGWFPEFVAIWGGVMAVLTAALAYLSFTYKRHATTPARARRHGIHHTVVVGGIGVAWGSGAWIIAGQSDEFLLFYTFVLGGTALGAVSTQHSLLRSCMLSIWTSIPLLSAALAVLGPDTFGPALAVLVMLFGLTLTITAMRMNRFLTDNVSLTVQLKDKVAELTALSKDLEAARQTAEQADRSKTELVAQASHDLRHPIHAIGLFVETLRSRTDDPEARSIIDRIDQSVDGMARLFRSLLDMSALDLGRIRPQMAPTRLDQVLNAVAEQAVDATEDGRLRAVPCASWVTTDPALLHTLVQNLVTNALKYGRGADVVVGCRRRGGNISIEIHDAGPGIEAKDLDRIFAPFVRLTPLDLGTGEGLGLGLSIVKRLAKLMGLTLRVRSTPGKGTMMAVDGLVPCPPPETKSKAPRPRQDTMLDGMPITVLDPDREMREPLAHLLRGWGCMVSTPLHPQEVPPETAFVLIDTHATMGMTASDWSTLPHTALVAVMTNSGETDDKLPQDVLRLAKPIRPIQLRSLLLTVAAKAKSPALADG